MAYAVALHKNELEPWSWREVGAVIIGLIGAAGISKLWPALIGLFQHKGDLSSGQSQRAFESLENQVNRLTERVNSLEDQGQKDRTAHATEAHALRQELAAANGEKERLTLLTVQQAAHIQVLEAKVAERFLADPEIRAAARTVALQREAEEELL